MTRQVKVCFGAAALSLAAFLACGSPEPRPDPGRPATQPAARPKLRIDSPGETVTHADPAEMRTHQVLPKDTLLGLALQYYGDRNQWRRIYYANRNRISDPDDLPVGMKLIIPPPP